MSKILHLAYTGVVSIAAMRDWTIYHIYLRAYLLGYDGKVMPRSLRKLLARSEIHNAWLLGFMGFFEQDGIRFGPANPYPGELAIPADR
ncbi:hypothetical protein G3A56_28175 (plasmid) [Rhizobium oryzihabitans]|jgi:hypothetical protein|uniref:Uncharacterized protein n=1 Tax=Rhizobium oryzihabitans TaxID=2267833 RepID=A0A7L5BS51_9HYPH|nr:MULTISPECIES: hypothetical protein [Rhizobium/Agrobacterium group]EGP54343.1 hypothetical protein Agau_P100065 [Agrobacterium tumefaciens F2]QIB41623.1 hypothetical protein G3A56_28175 [Rhizobium oryzihabitans]TQN58140.1 hypothetical protein FLX27_26575 [Agrobacterium tumefaciens]